jgi:hypothetical protein
VRCRVGIINPRLLGAGPGDSGRTSWPVGVASAGKNRAPPSLVVYTCPEGAVQMTVQSGNFLGYRRQQGEANCRRFGVTLAPCVRLMRSKPSPSKCSANASAPVNLGFPSNREGFPYAAAGWSAASLSYWMGDINAAEMCRRRLL